VNGADIRIEAAVPGIARRLPDADVRLTAFARRWKNEVFEWGRCDCTLLMAHAVDALAGTSFAALYEGRWHDEPSAREFQRGFGGDLESALLAAGLEDAFEPDLALEERVRSLRRGDLILCRMRGFCCGHVAFGALSLSVDRDHAVGWRPSAELLAWPGAVTLRVR
jgi:hypothetical protein